MAVQLLIQAETINELRTKTLAALHMYEQGTQAIPPMPSQPQTQAPTAPPAAAPQAAQAPVNDIAKARSRRSKAEIEAERQSKNVGAKAKDVIQNNFQAADEVADIESPIEDGADVGDMMGEEENAPIVDVATAQAALKGLIGKTGFGNLKSLQLLQKHGSNKVTTLTDQGRANFYAEAMSILNG